ncbi:hypothetical protein SAMN05216588_11243 [Pseudomonas flavescens]|uniref:EpsG family protein n=1 Tax=Phytopseudomonas flavescens TaxID=29435 RepID=A0A1G8IC54_9GAMM|nr:hypothetical protein [Pseudomonas flavescens]SDI16464.1 hypothetical protein SAMN05216588_11243 [Pseudomonas flavescens]
MSAGQITPDSHWLDQEYSDNHTQKFCILLLTFVVVFFTSYEHHFDEWVYTQWVLNYDFGLVRRGLVGGLLKAFGYVPSPHFYMVAAFLFSLAVCSALFWLLSRAALSYRKQSTAAFLLALFFICHPLIVLHFAQASGFLDNINYLIVILGIAAILKAPPKLGALAVLLAGGLIIPIHEASFVMFVPLLIGIWSYTHRPKVVSVDSVLILIVFAVLVAEVVTIGTSNPGSRISLQHYYEHLLSTTQPIDIEAVGILFNTLHGNSSETASVMLSVLYLNFHLNMLFGLIPTFFIGAKLFKALAGHIRLISYESFLLASAVSPLALYLIASDYTRWWSIAVSNTAIALTLLMRDPVLAGAMTAVVNRYKWFIVFAIGFGLALGPFTSDLSYRNLNWLYSL